MAVETFRFRTVAVMTVCSRHQKHRLETVVLQIIDGNTRSANIDVSLTQSVLLFIVVDKYKHTQTSCLL